MSKTPPSKLSFEAAMTELESLVNGLEQGQMPLEASVKTYQRGLELIRHCQTRLSEVEQQIAVLDEQTLKPWSEPHAEH